MNTTAKVNRKQTEVMIERVLTEQPGLCDAPDATTWIWSDLHLGNLGSARAFDRPFRTVREMDQAMMDAWYELVGRTDTIICLGDATVDGSVLAHHQEWWREAPGTKLLVLGNHDLNRAALREAGFTMQCSLALCATDPPLALSHYPLRQIPVGAINLHGRLHEGTEPTRRHINLAVEQTDYSPVGLIWILDKARQRQV